MESDKVELCCLCLVVDPRIPIGSVVFEHGIDDPKDLMSNSDYRALVPPTYHKTLIFAFELTICFARGVCNFAQYSTNIPIALSSTSTFTLAGTFIIPRAHTRP